jgi:hypothetical protein
MACLHATHAGSCCLASYWQAPSTRAALGRRHNTLHASVFSWTANNNKQMYDRNHTQSPAAWQTIPKPASHTTRTYTHCNSPTTSGHSERKALSAAPANTHPSVFSAAPFQLELPWSMPALLAAALAPAVDCCQRHYVPFADSLAAQGQAQGDIVC